MDEEILTVPESSTEEKHVATRVVRVGQEAMTPAQAF